MREETWTKLLWFDLLLLAFLILGTRLATLLHELLGHALTALLAGGRVNAVRVSLLGGGQVLHDLPDGAGLLARVVVAGSGIAVNLLTGAWVFHRLRRAEAGRLRDGFWILFAGVSLLGGTAYAALGFYYGQGDPVAWMTPGSRETAWACLPFLAAAPFLGFVAVKAFASWVAHWFPSPSFTGRLLVLTLTAGAAASAYAGLYHAGGSRSRALDAPEAARMEAERRIVRVKLEDLVQHLRRTRPELTDAEIRRIVEQTPVTIRPEEIPRKLPLKPALAILFGVGGLAALLRAGPVSGAEARFGPRFVVPASALAVGMMGILYATGGWLYRAPGLLP